MKPDVASLSRRNILRSSLGVAAVMGASAGAATLSESPPTRSDPVELAAAVAPVNVRSFGAVGDGIADDTAAISNAIANLTEGSTLYLPQGKYRVTSLPAVPSYVTVYGDGTDASQIVYAGAGTLFTVAGRLRVRFYRLTIHVVSTTGTAIRLSNSFQCTLDSVHLAGDHVGGNYPTFAQTRGLVLDSNSGGNVVVNSNIDNFGTGIVTSCIQNYVADSKMSTNYVSILGTGNNFAAGMGLSNVEFVGDSVTSMHIRVDGRASDWWITNCWFEGADTAISIGLAGTGGPASLGIINSKVAARRICIDLQHCRQPYLANVAIDPDGGYAPTELRINGQYCAFGTAIGLISGQSGDVAPASYPVGWFVVSRTQTMLTVLGRPLVSQVTGANDAVTVVNQSGVLQSAILSSGALYSARADAGVILTSPGGTKWRLTVDDYGRVTPTNIGGARPTA